MNTDVTAYNAAQKGEERTICELLATEIDSLLTGATNKIWHGAPVWFLDGNPIVGYAVRKHDVQLLFWSGQSFDEPNLRIEGTFKAAEARYSNVEQIDTSALHRWLKKAQKIQWDYKNIIKREGELVRVEI